MPTPNSKPVFHYQQALEALQGKIVITDEDSPFKWVGSSDAGSCIIIMLHAIDDRDKKIALCGHLSPMESPSTSLDAMFIYSEIKTIKAVYLISADTKETNPTVQELLTNLAKRGVLQPQLLLGHGVSKAAIHVETGDIEYNPLFTYQNSGHINTQNFLIKTLLLGSSYRNLVINHTAQRQALELSIDGRNSEDIARMQALLEKDTPALAAKMVLGTVEKRTDDEIIQQKRRYLGLPIVPGYHQIPITNKMLTNPEANQRGEYPLYIQVCAELLNFALSNEDITAPQANTLAQSFRDKVKNASEASWELVSIKDKVAQFKENNSLLQKKSEPLLQEQMSIVPVSSPIRFFNDDSALSAAQGTSERIALKSKPGTPLL